MNSRKSNVVKEIEKIQEQREQRRAAAAQPQSYSGIDKSHPHWQFLDMIELVIIQTCSNGGLYSGYKAVVK